MLLKICCFSWSVERCDVTEWHFMPTSSPSRKPNSADREICAKLGRPIQIAAHFSVAETRAISMYNNLLKSWICSLWSVVFFSPIFFGIIRRPAIRRRRRNKNIAQQKVPSSSLIFFLSIFGCALLSIFLSTTKRCERTKQHRFEAIHGA